METIPVAIKERRSIRKYEERPVPQELLDGLLEAVRWSPSWANTQCWELIVVTEPALKENLQAILSPKNPATKAMVQAPAVIAFCAQMGKAGYYNEQASTKFNDWFMYDLGIATQSLCLAAQACGLGTVIIGSFDQDKAGEILKVPAGYEVVSLVPLGYPAKIGPAPKRREINEFTHYNAF